MNKPSRIRTAAHSALASILAFVTVSTHSGSAQAQDPGGAHGDRWC
jgi:hypothetical protein